MNTEKKSGPDWMGLLQWSLQYQDGTSPTELNQLTQEKKEFLAKVFDSMTVNEPERLHFICNKMIEYLGQNKYHAYGHLQHIFECKQADNVLHDADKIITDDDLEEYLEECEDIVQQIDMANAFVTKYNGLQYLFMLLLHNCDNNINKKYNIRCKVASIVALLSQNNETVQAVLYKTRIAVGSTEEEVISSLEFFFVLYQSLSISSNNEGNENEHERVARLKLCSKVIYIISAVLSFIPFQQQIFMVGDKGADTDANKYNKSNSLCQLLIHGMSVNILSTSIITSSPVISAFR